jgi:hypothetical protein
MANHTAPDYAVGGSPAIIATSQPSVELAGRELTD